jgi:hypothetical protein
MFPLSAKKLSDEEKTPSIFAWTRKLKLQAKPIMSENQSVEIVTNKNN